MNTTVSLIAASVLSFSTIFGSAGHSIPMAEESYVDDIPFNTRLIAINTIIPPSDEMSADDIPFNTAAIAMIYKPCPIPMDQEAEVDDIPFNTAEVAAKYAEEFGSSTTGAPGITGECEHSSIHGTDEIGIILTNLSQEIEYFLQHTLGNNYMSVIESPQALFEEIGRLFIEELNFFGSYFNSLKSF